jgi:YHS domain-containing protein
LKHDNKTFYFCCEGCKGIFKRKPNKYNKKWVYL